MIIAAVYFFFFFTYVCHIVLARPWINSTSGDMTGTRHRK